jgi:hypothetical protein
VAERLIPDINRTKQRREFPANSRSSERNEWKFLQELYPQPLTGLSRHQICAIFS